MSDTVTLRVVSGPRAGETFDVGLRHPVVVGRAQDATVSIDAPGLSRQHFELRWNGNACHLRDLESRNGVTVNGRHVTEATVYPNDEICAADCRFSIEIVPTRRRIISEIEGTVASDKISRQTPGEAATMVLPLAVYDDVKPTITAVPPPAEEGTLLASLARATQASGRTFAIVDGAQAFELAFTARLMGNRIYTLFSGALAVDLAHVGPCLVDISIPRPYLVEWIRAIGRHAGVLVQTRADLPTVYRHMRSIFVATDENHQEYFFRFYDPRVLRVYLPTCTASELAEFFGPIESWIVENPEADRYLVYSAGSGLLEISDLAGTRPAE